MTTSSLFDKIPSILSISPSKAQSSPKAAALRRNADVFEDMCIVKPLNKTKFPVYLVKSRVDDQMYVMKIFPYDENEPALYFQNEVRFCFVNHPNIIRMHHIEYEKQAFTRISSKKVSYIIMEYASYGDFFDFVMNYKQDIDDMLIRTYFHQLIEGLEYLHNNGVSHMDLKLENLLLGQDLNLKIVDFDLSYFTGDSKILSRGTKFYRSPELIQGKHKYSQAADIYSAGIILFALKTRGMLPHAEENRAGGIDFAGLLYTNNKEFWTKHCEFQKKDPSFFDQDFKDLFNAMVRLNPKDRPTIQQIKQYKWYNGPCYTYEELKAKVGKLLSFRG